ncbi:GNAT family N-acetyltransferase [Botrimarina sp.]|uniref:GNAT family N-acetyltransferase n=1 Tax=Botrimarina sp. TaxID=2795802 RepID=UPI0032EF602C
MLVRPIEYGSADYQAAKELRRRFLREPLGLELTDADTAGEDHQHHYGLFAAGDPPAPDGWLLGAAIGMPDALDPATVRIRQVVVHSDWRSRGAGRQLMAEAERALAALGFQRCVLYARENAQSFYERCGYRATGAAKELIGLPHLEFQKRLTESATNRL